MTLERTFAIVKPDAVKDGHIGEIIAAIEQSGLKIVGLKLTQLTRAICQGFYHEHVGKGFYPELEAFMTEGPVAIMVLEGENAILRWRDLMGATNPANAAEGTLRKRFGASIGRNATHGSDKPESAKFEVSYFFNAFEQM
ncbi:nucleoside diphosphate kinase [Geothrix oryzae]|uniref:Nucleoside diphosphate kinase n=1 Tax=Geothrix oryzae TaxID=2927975 RepID=A0ABN6UZ30_9BACT|nr:nucleoside-diphosphate kinase [Geothrix oryzae]BDU69628.1 nucleoside diphosphate kinase [Geothrix oryzae]